jgi:hypothetical protein
MPTVLTAPPEAASLTPTRKLWTRHECEQMAEAGLLDWEHYELIEGDLFSTMGKNRPHSIAVRMLTILLGNVFGERRVESEAGFEVAIADAEINAPQPDVAVLARDTTAFRVLPLPSDVTLAAVVSDSTLYLIATSRPACTPAPASPNTGSSTFRAVACSFTAIPSTATTHP